MSVHDAILAGLLALGLAGCATAFVDDFIGRRDERMEICRLAGGVAAVDHFGMPATCIDSNRNVIRSWRGN